MIYALTDVGDKLLSRTHVDKTDDKGKAVAEALQIARQKHDVELRNTIEQLRQEAEREKHKALAAARKHYEQLAVTVAEERKRAEDQRTDAMQKQWMEVLQAELKAQQANFDKQREAIIEDGISDLRKALRAEFALAKERDVAAALKRARDGFRQREQEIIEFTRRDCEKAAAVERQNLQQEYDEKLDGLQQQYDELLEQFEAEISYRQLVEQDFKELQNDYRRFLDNTNGRFHSDYMMRIRPYGTDSEAPAYGPGDHMTQVVQQARARSCMLPRRPESF